ncbi:hypothetical protein [Bowdeniella nasicola]|uniref:hypothetical protein n=1 Tax=Bowdeniella nasicola TaxID=208480 RepID=UPI0013011799|nr:hypothetical protein [Bowdeniella nasicola]
MTWHLMALIQVEELLEYLGVIIATWAVAEMVLVQRDGQKVQLAFRGYREPSAPAGA